MAKRQSEAVAASLLTSWTDADTAMQIVGTSIGVFGAGPLDPTNVLATETPLRNALFDVLLSLVEGGAVEMRTTGDDRYAFRWRSDIAVAGLMPNPSTAIDLAVPSPYLAELERARADRDAATRRADAADTLAAERELQLKLVAEVARAAEVPVATVETSAPAPVRAIAPKPAPVAKAAPKAVVRKPALKKVAPERREPVNAEPVKALPAKGGRKPAAKKSAPKQPAAQNQELLYLTPPEADAEPDIDLTVEGHPPEPRPARRPKWAGYAIDRSRPHLAPVETSAEDG